MKKSLLMLFAAVLLVIPAVNAQKINPESFLAKIAKSDADIADAKKGAKSSTWVNRGKIFYEAAAEPTKNLFVNMDAPMLKLTLGDPQSMGKENVAGKDFDTWVYPYFVAYFQNNKLVAWKQTKSIIDNGVEKSLEAYNKAVEMDAKAASKVKGGLEMIVNYCSQIGNVGLETGEYAKAAAGFAQAYEAQCSPALNEPNEQLLYYAGYLLAVDGSNNPQSFTDGMNYLLRALEKGYMDEDGSIYYYLFHCYYGQKAEHPEYVMEAKNALLTGIEKFPKNERILDGLMQLYTAEKGVGDPADLVKLIEGAIAENPTNVDLWFGRGRIFYALKNIDESIASFTKVCELKPDLYEGNYYLGLFYTMKGDAMNREANDKQYSSQAAYDEELKNVNQVYLAAVPWFEKALEVKPNDPDAVEFLKQLCFRLRDEEGMMDKYNKYNALFKQIKGLE